MAARPWKNAPMTAANAGASAPSTPDLNALAAQYGRLVSSLCWRMTRDEEKAREAAQEAWLEIARGLPTFEGRSSLSTWIFQVAWRAVRRHTLDERRYSVRFLREYFAGPEVEAGPMSDPERRAWVKSMCDKCLAGTLQCLEPEARMAYLLRDVADLEYEEVAQVLGKEPATARQLASRARRKLQAFLTDQCALANPDGPCRCRMRRHVAAVDLPAEYARLRASMRLVRLYRESNQVLPQRAFWPPQDR
ncbi:MAG: sigma-70 family RNA polymerase sigma factor [Myxococcales bacterium]